MARAKLKLPPQHKDLEKQIFEIVSTRGLGKATVAKMLSLPVKYFHRYEGTLENFEKAMAIFINEILMKTVTETLDIDHTMKRFLINKLRVFDDEITLPVARMMSAQDAMVNLSYIIQMYSEKKISDDTIEILRKNIQTFVQLYESSEFQRQLDEIKALIAERLPETVG